MLGLNLFSKMIIIFAFTSFTFFYSNNLKAQNLKQSEYFEACLKYKDRNKCFQLIRNLEDIQVKATKLGKYRCQSSLLGLQSEILARMEDAKFNNRKLHMTSFVIDYCKDFL
tara:strand:+ start:3067 stop:3402 length:336 start_codon:yes stop_codon:yes gene_type:complete